VPITCAHSRFSSSRVMYLVWGVNAVSQTVKLVSYQGSTRTTP
jgi:hypothetical protein